MNTEKIKRVFFDILSASITWVIFFYYRKKILEKTNFEISDTLIYGTLGVSVLWLIIYTLSGTYIDVRRVSRLNELYRTIFQTIVGSILIFFFLIIDDIENYNNYTLYYEAILILSTLHFLFTFFTRYTLTNSMVKKINNKEITFKTILIGTPKSILNTFNAFTNMKRSAGNEFIGYINTEDSKAIKNLQIRNLGEIQNLANTISTHEIEEAILAFDDKHNYNITEIINTLIYNEIITKVTPNMMDVLSGKVKMQSFFNISLIQIEQIKMSVFQKVIKRLTDIIASITALTLLSPLLISIALVVKMTSKGPVFYTQKRIGYKKNYFNIIKFRSMHVNAEKNTPLLSSEHDKRITSFGKIMRRYRLDELPQFYNVLIGEMSIIGPRPEREFFAKQILLKAPHYKLIYKVKPGITSWGMVKFGYAENVDEMVARLKYDIIYLENLSLLNDFKVFLLTIFIVIQGRGK